MKQGSKNIPRLGRRSDPYSSDSGRNYNHVQPIDSKFLFDFLNSNDISEGDLKFLSWDDLDRALESDGKLKQKLASIARDNEIEQLRRFAMEVHQLDDGKNRQVPHKFVPYDSHENDVYYYYNGINDDKRSEKIEPLTKI